MGALRTTDPLAMGMQPPIAPAFLNRIRFAAMGCRAKPRIDLFRACALLHGQKDATQHAHAEALVRCLNEALGSSARLLAPGAAELSFDERWLVALGAAIERGDEPSLTFLLRRRVAREHRRLLRFLVQRVADDPAS